MRSKFVPMNDALYRYVVEHGHNGDPLLAELAAETERLGDIVRMQISPEQGTFLSLLVRAIGARSAIEIGTFTGYSALCLARASPPGPAPLLRRQRGLGGDRASLFRQGRPGGPDRPANRPRHRDPRHLAGGANVRLRLRGRGQGGLRVLHEALLPRLRTDGLIVFDNVLWSGRVADPSDDGVDTIALRRLNELVAHDTRVEAVMLGSPTASRSPASGSPGKICRGPAARREPGFRPCDRHGASERNALNLTSLCRSCCPCRSMGFHDGRFLHGPRPGSSSLTVSESKVFRRGIAGAS